MNNKFVRERYLEEDALQLVLDMIEEKIVSLQKKLLELEANNISDENYINSYNNINLFILAESIISKKLQEINDSTHK